MLGGRLIIILFTHNALLLLVVCSQDAFGCKQRYGRAGGTIEISPGSINEKLVVALWNFKEIKIADKNAEITGHPFTGRMSLNTSTYSLTIRELKITDSGNFTFVSSGEEGKQKPTQCFKLVVQEVLAQTPKLNIFNTTHVSNASCVVWLQCGSTLDKDVSYKWTVKNQTINGPTLQYTLKPQEGDTAFTCTVFNMVSETSETSSVNCKTSDKKVFLLAILIGVGVVCGIIVIIFVVVLFCRQKRGRSASDADDLTVYAEIEEVSSDKVMKPCSVYETLEKKTIPVKPPAQTIYDQIQFSRMIPQ